MQDSLSIFARALASENLSFSFDSSAETAAFDVKNRHLVLPVWDVSGTVSTMLVAHEIAHALWTPHQESEDILNAAEAQGYNKVVLHRIANVIEDTRIEKLMKAKYPGTRRDFFLGYKEMIDKNMFGLAEANYDKMGLVNRVNIFFKWGAPGFVHVSLSDEERKIVDRIDNVQTFAEVYEIAKFLYDHPSMGEEIESALEKLKAQGNNGEQEAADGVAQDITGGIGKKDGETYVASSVTITPVKSMKNVIFSTDALLRQFEEQNEHNLPYLSFLKDYRVFVKEIGATIGQNFAGVDVRTSRWEGYVTDPQLLDDAVLEGMVGTLAIDDGSTYQVTLVAARSAYGRGGIGALLESTIGHVVVLDAVRQE